MQTGVVTEATPVPDADDPSAWLTLSELADSIGEEHRKVRQLVRERRLITVRRNGADVVPADFVSDGRLVRGLGGLTTLLRDAGYGDDESLSWMFTPHDALGGTPLQAMAEGRSKEVNRLAQTLGF